VKTFAGVFGERNRHKEGDDMRVPLVYTASEIVNWHISEEYKQGKWRPARCCGFDAHDWSLVKVRFRMAWRVFTGRYDALNWGETSGELSERRYKDCTDPEFFTATKVYEPPPQISPFAGRYT
jgi:hypothetical protein